MNAVEQKTARTPLKIGALVSGGGRTVLNIAERIRAGALNASIEIVISSRVSAKAVERCRAVGLDVVVVERSGGEGESFDDEVTKRLRVHGCDLVCMCGFNCLWKIPPEFAGRVINIHPALLPAHGGQGFYGHRVHRAVIDANESISGCTVHYADNQYDHGPILLQETVAVDANDDADMLAAKVFAKECIAYPKAIAMFTSGAAPLPHPDLASVDSARTD